LENKKTAGLKTNDFFYDLPKELIAQSPLPNRSDSRLLTLDKKTGEIGHKYFYDIIGLLNKGDCLVLNDTKVMPARLIGSRLSKATTGGAKIELLLLERKDSCVWETLARPGRRVKPGDKIVFGGGELTAEVLSEGSEGIRYVRFIFDGVFEQILDRLGEAPLPPYITEKLADKSRYQTVYADETGSAAAPTAGLHFTNELLARAEEKGVIIAKLTLHVGLGTFRPVKAVNIDEHKMHSEYYRITDEAAAKINSAKKSGARVVAVGTTSARSLESAADGNGFVSAKNCSTDIFIYPPYEFKIADALITNFHLPESTLIMLVSALAGRENIIRAYEAAVREKYRFYSFGDAMFIY